ncbi:MAG: pentapeptide repeat-containing protein [Legionella longbeachae]|nr:pentapeptide repeat-containing protein [Legionella longbeachae]
MKQKSEIDDLEEYQSRSMISSQELYDFIDDNLRMKRCHRSESLVETVDFFHKLSKLRKAELYLTLNSKIEQSKHLTNNELIYFAMITDDVNLLYKTRFVDMNVLSIKIKELARNLFIMQTALAYSVTHEEHERNIIKQKLNRQLQVGHKRHGESDPKQYFFNLSKIKLEGANLFNCDLSFCSLIGSQLKGAEINLADFSFSNLTNADLSETKTQLVLENKRIDNSNVAIAIYGAIIKQACIIDTSLPLLTHLSDFSGSNFSRTQVSILNRDTYDLCFDHCDFSYGKFKYYHLVKGTTFKQASFIKCDFEDYPSRDWLCDDLGDIKLIAENIAFQSIQSLKVALDEAYQDYQKYLTKKEHTYQLLTKMLARQIVTYLTDTNLENKDKLCLLDVAINHKIFQPIQKAKYVANTVSYYAQSLFSNKVHFCYETSGLKKLEKKRDELQEQSLSEINLAKIL